jgi:hypothetical protein
MRFITIFAMAAVAITLAGCNVAARDAAVDAEVVKVFDQVRAGDPALMARLTPEMAKTATPELWAKIRAYVPAGKVVGRKALGTATFSSPSGRAVNATDEYDFGDRTALVQTQLELPAGSAQWRISGFHVQTATAKELEANRFLAAGKPPLQYLGLLAAICSPMLMIAALVKVIRTKGLRRKWLWGILAFVGLTSFQMNWTTGQVNFNPLTVQLIGFGVVKALSAFAPWIITMTVPIGALLILTGVWGNPKRAKPRPPTPEQAF